MNKLITMYYIIEHCYILLYYINFVPPNRTLNYCATLSAVSKETPAPRSLQKEKSFCRLKFRGDLEIQHRSERATTGEYGG